MHYKAANAFQAATLTKMYMQLTHCIFLYLYNYGTEQYL